MLVACSFAGFEMGIGIRDAVRVGLFVRDRNDEVALGFVPGGLVEELPLEVLDSGVVPDGQRGIFLELNLHFDFLLYFC